MDRAYELKGTRTGRAFGGGGFCAAAEVPPGSSRAVGRVNNTRIALMEHDNEDCISDSGTVLA